MANAGNATSGAGKKANSLISTDYYKDARARADAMYNAYAKGREAQRAKDIQQNNTNRDAELAKSNAQYDASGRQNYINYMQARKNAPNQLNAMGIRGGASESSLIRLGTNYNSNVAANNLARNNAASEITNNYAQMLFDLNKAYDEDLATKRAAYLEKADSEAKAEEARQLQYFAQAITGQYKTKDGYKKLIKKLQESNDPQKVAKIMLARQAMNALKEENSGGGGGGGSSRSYGGSSSGSSSGSDNNTTTTWTRDETAYSNAQSINDKYKNRAAQAKKNNTWSKYGTPKSSGRWVG